MLHQPVPEADLPVQSWSHVAQRAAVVGGKGSRFKAEGLADEISPPISIHLARLKSGWKTVQFVPPSFTLTCVC
jgi:hypothetical protein